MGDDAPPLALPLRLARVALLYAASVLLAVLVGRIGGAGPGGALFVMGALAIGVSILFIRTGSDATWRVSPKRRTGALAWVPRLERDASGAETRRAEQAVGLSVFLYGLALWAMIFLWRGLFGSV